MADKDGSYLWIINEPEMTMTKNTTELLQESDLENVTGGGGEVEIHLCPPSRASRSQNGTVTGGGPHVKGLMSMSDDGA